MITTTQIRKADAAVAYFKRELATSDYYLAEKGLWYGTGARILGLAPEVRKEDFVAIVNNQTPGSGKRLTARNNTTRTRIVWKLDQATQTKVPVQEQIPNRRVCVDFTFSVPKSVSMYLARTKDAEGRFSNSSICLVLLQNSRTSGSVKTSISKSLALRRSRWPAAINFWARRE